MIKKIGWTVACGVALYGLARLINHRFVATWRAADESSTIAEPAATTEMDGEIVSPQSEENDSNRGSPTAAVVDVEASEANLHGDPCGDQQISDRDDAPCI